MQACALTGNWTGDPLVLRLALNPVSHTSQGLKPPLFSDMKVMCKLIADKFENMEYSKEHLSLPAKQ